MSYASHTIIVTGGVVAPLGQPSGLAVSGITSAQAVLTWASAFGAVAYAVWVNGQVVQTVVGLTATITGLSAGTAYSVAVSSVSSVGAQSPPSSPVMFTTSPSGGVTNQFAAYPTRFVDGLNGLDTPGGNAFGYATIQYGLNDWLVQRQRRLVVLPTATYNLLGSNWTTFPPDNGTVTSGYRVLEGDVTQATKPTVNLNCWGFFPANNVACTGIAIRWLHGKGLGNLANTALPAGSGGVQRGMIFNGFLNTFLIEGNTVDGIFNTNSSGNAGFLGYNQGAPDAPTNGTWNQNILTNCGCNTSGGGVGDNCAIVYTWMGTNLTITNNTGTVWSHAVYIKGASSPPTPPQNIQVYGNKFTLDPATNQSNPPMVYFAPLSAPVACPGGNKYHHNLLVGGGTALVSSNYNETAVGTQGTDVEIYNNTSINCAALHEVNDSTNTQVHSNIHVPKANADSMCGITRPPTGGFATVISLFDFNWWYSGLGFSATAWQLDRFGTPTHNFSSFSGGAAPWNNAFTSTGTTELTANPDQNGGTFASTTVFNNFAGGDYTLAPASPLIGKGKGGNNPGCYDGSMSIGQTWG